MVVCVGWVVLPCSLDSGVGSALKRVSPVVHTSDGCQPAICLPAAPVIARLPFAYLPRLPATASAAGDRNQPQLPCFGRRRHKVPAAVVRPRPRR